MKSLSRGLLIAGMLIVVSACGDANTTDSRGYTKAPLEHAGVLIKAERSTAMDSLGSPMLPRDTLIPPEPAAAPAPTQTRD